MDIDDSIVVPKQGQPKRKRASMAGCCFVLLAICGLFLVGGIGLGIGVAVYSGLRAIVSPHNDIHHLEPNMTTAVLPLIDGDTRFDVALTIWARRPNVETAHPDRFVNYTWMPEDAGEAARLEAIQKATKMLPAVEHYQLPEEEVLYSGVVIRDFSLASKEHDVELGFDLPLKRFYDPFLYPSDVRAVLSFIPHSPSRVDNVMSFNEVRPSKILRPPAFDDSLKQFADMGEDDSLRRGVLQSLAVDVPLIYLLNEREEETGKVTVNTIEDSVDIDRIATDIMDTAWRAANKRKHPYLYTRVHVYMINETRPLKRDVFLPSFTQLQAYACRKGVMGLSPYPSHQLCQWPYIDTGYWKARYVLSTDGEENRTHAYAPYASYVDQSKGPLHRMRLPVHRLDEPPPEGQSDPESVRVNLTLRMSSIKPMKASIAGFMEETTQSVDDPNVWNATEHEAQARHDWWALTNGLFGSPLDGVPAWRRALIHTSHFLTDASVFILGMLYWYTRSTAAGVSHKAAWLAAVSALATWGNGIYLVQGVVSGALILMLGFFFDVLPQTFQLWLVFPAMIDTARGWTIQRRRWTHRERASMRKELSWLQCGYILTAMSGVFFATARYALYAIRPAFPGTAKTNGRNEMLLQLVQYALLATSRAVQLVLNARVRSFAGDFALTAYLRFIGCLLDIAYHFPRVMGRHYVAPGLQLADAVLIALAAVEVYQAATLPRVEQNVADEDE